MDDCGSFNTSGRGILVLEQGKLTFGADPSFEGCSVRSLFCDPKVFWYFDNEIFIPEGTITPVSLEVGFYDLARRGSNREIEALNENGLFDYSTIFGAVITECHLAIQTAHSEVLLMKDEENIFPFKGLVDDEDREGELLVALDQDDVWTVALRNYPSTAYNAGDRVFFPGKACPSE